jgi:hypothetical protein
VSIRLPRGTTANLLDTSHASGVFFLPLEFDGPVSTLHLVGSQDGGSATSATFQVFQFAGAPLYSSPDQVTLGSPVDFGGTGSPALATYSTLSYNGYGSFLLVLNVGSNGSSTFTLSILGEPS